jgi:hypothetical protein
MNSTGTILYEQCSKNVTGGCFVELLVSQTLIKTIRIRLDSITLPFFIFT